ncbi:oligosaccharide flippase family protein [Myroides odoratimimus]|uniref:oligosaccharide flippase family protein n=1 Tax=Myroides odoratimimus TaxID=76832 RepID=UPI0025777766|nr:oligosaccharide flippase family protein [Myroides odoratimimus]MDM1465226.1 oligosaccharide flippase family protein [Myroides odoratimimus]MDM1475230.1 oligosaccharide flippase family protein [Myroides odoratimimus]MDM1485063.1 oligosaccharide flippase family protein [Myroides odoratimimus]
MIKNGYQTKINLIYNVITFLINALIGLVLPTFLIKKLGISTYSLIPLSMSITSFMVLVTISINGTLSRYLSIDFEKNKNDVNKTFSTSFYLLLGLMLLLLPLVIYFLLNPERFLSIEQSDLQDAKSLFLFTIIAFIMNSFASLFNSIPYVRNRIDLRNIALIINRLGIVVFIVILFLIGYINIQAYGVAVFLATFFSLFYSIRTARKIFPELSIKLRFFDRYQLMRIARLGFWLIINQIGVVLFLQADIIIVNKILGAKQSGVYGTLIQWSFLVRTLVSMVAGVLGPLVLSLYAKNKIKELIDLTKFSTKVLGIFSAIISITIVYFSKDILGIWLGKEFEVYYYILMLIVFHLGFNNGYSSVINLNIAYNKAKIPGLVTILTGGINIAIGIWLLKYTSLGLFGVAIAGCISLTLKNLIFTPLYLSHIMKLDKKIYLKPILPSLIITIIGLIITFLVPSSVLGIQSFASLIFYGGVFVVVISICSWLLFFTPAEKSQLKSLAYSKIKNKK